jgi:hypothetical protein
MARLRFRIPAKGDPDAMDDDSGSSGKYFSWNWLFCKHNPLELIEQICQEITSY